MATKNPQRLALGQGLKAARMAAGKSTTEVEEELGWHVGKASRVEAGTRVPVRAEIDRLCELFAIPAGDRPTIRLLADAARRRETPSRVADFAQEYVTLERSACRIDYYDAELVPGLLQTVRYAREVIIKSGSPDVEGRLADRVARQKILTPDGPRLRAVLGEAVLHREVGGEAVLLDQLRHLVQVSQLDTVGVRILPFSIGAHRGLGIGFTYLELAEPSITRVYTEGFTDATYIHEEDETSVYASEFDRLWAVAADDRASATILRRRIDN